MRRLILDGMGKGMFDRGQRPRAGRPGQLLRSMRDFAITRRRAAAEHEHTAQHAKRRAPDEKLPRGEVAGKVQSGCQRLSNRPVHRKGGSQGKQSAKIFHGAVTLRTSTKAENVADRSTTFVR